VAHSLDRYGRTAMVVGVALVAAVGVALFVARRRRPMRLTARLHDALPDSVSSRIERPLSSLKGSRRPHPTLSAYTRPG
jgi:hypothetical protein